MRTLTCLVAVLTAVAGCSGSGKPVLFILPNTFRGEFRVVKDSAHGADLVTRNGQWVFEIPASGVLRVKDDRPFYRWQAEQARYADGRPVTIESVRTEAGCSPDQAEVSTDYDGTTHVWKVR